MDPPPTPTHASDPFWLSNYDPLEDFLIMRRSRDTDSNRLIDEKVIEYLAKHKDMAGLIKKSQALRDADVERREALTRWAKDHPSHPFVW